MNRKFQIFEASEIKTQIENTLAQIVSEFWDEESNEN